MEELSNIKSRFKVCGDAWLPVRVFFNEEGDGGDVPSH
jgi:hypothetical protein